MASKITKEQPSTKTDASTPQVSKEDAVAVEKSLALLTRKEGATVENLMTETGLTNPQVRTLLSRLRRQGHEVINTGRCEFRVPVKGEPEQKQPKATKKATKPKAAKVENKAENERQTVTNSEPQADKPA